MAFNIGNFVQLMRGGQNPQQMVIQMLEEQAQNNPFAKNLLNLAKENKTNDIEQITRNMCKQQGKDFDKEFASFRNMFGL